MAAASLALHPPPGFTASLLRETTIALKIAVTGDDRERDGWESVGMCGDSLALTPEPGWPQPFTYVVEEHWPSEQTIERILIDGFPDISFSRARSNSSCSTVSGFTSVQKLRLAQQEAGPPFLEKRGDTLQYDTLRYTDPATFAPDLAALIASHRQPFLDLRKALVGKGFIEPAEEASAQPEMEVEIDDQRKTGAAHSRARKA